MPLKTSANEDASATGVGTAVYLLAGGKPCIGVQLVNKAGNTPAHIVFSENTTNKDKGVCQQVIKAEPVDAYFKSKIGSGDTDKSKMAVGSSKGVYKAAS
ncbi:hypothetical protein [Campylobacter sp.]|uniref:hypothetical protein n=1 Tax=Campylobacter sp. TaxID=205 RepID=UPI002AA68B5C|nr:hypothetical protein [Campylobacter sp.]MCI7236910.1 hypothetical protein [Campylobacter sp.]